MMQQVAPGKHQMAHYAFASGIMNLGVMLPGMMSGFVSDWLGYKYFFIVTLLAMIPSFLVAYFVPFTYDDKGNKLVLYIFSKYYILIICLFIITSLIKRII